MTILFIHTPSWLVPTIAYVIFTYNYVICKQPIELKPTLDFIITPTMHK